MIIPKQEFIMRTRSFLLVAAAVTLLGSTSLISPSYAQSASGSAGAARAAAIRC
jgi:hypothetical protein